VAREMSSMGIYGWIAMILLMSLGQAACTPRESRTDEAGPAPVDTTAIDTVAAPGPDTSVATPPINPDPSQATVDTPPAGAPPGKPARAGASRVSKQEYEGWRQYSVHCARCHGQDVLPNPVAANLLVSLGAGGSVDTPEKFADIVSAGRPAKGMPAFKGALTPVQITTIYAYVKGRADKRIPPGRPEESQD
jgi:mono/diheme cytochrome c family protein